MTYTARQRLGLRVLMLFSVTSLLVGFLMGRTYQKHAQSLDVAPAASSDGRQAFQPTDTAPYCLPSGTVAYEVCDVDTRTRYWVLRWPEGKGYAIVPRMVLQDGQLVPYWPEYTKESGDD